MMPHAVHPKPKSKPKHTPYLRGGGSMESIFAAVIYVIRHQELSKTEITDMLEDVLDELNQREGAIRSDE
jgi:hypothetical protein